MKKKSSESIKKSQKTNDNDTYITHDELANGVMNTFDYSYNHLKSCILLHDNKHFHMSIISGIFSLEEALKGYSYMEYIFKNKGINKTEYNELKDHVKKIMKVIKKLTRADQEIGFENIEDYNDICEKRPYDKTTCVLANDEIDLEKIYRNLPGLRSYFTYTDWNESKKIWSNFDKGLNKESQNDLSSLILVMAMILLNNLKYIITNFVDDMKDSKRHSNYYLHDPGLIFIEQQPKHKQNMKKIHNTNKQSSIVKKFENYCKLPNFVDFSAIIDQELQKRFKNTTEIKEHIFTIMQKIGPFLKSP